MKHEGSCLCGKVTFTIKEAELKVSACHCKMCRSWTSGPLLAIAAGTSENIHFNNEVSIGRFQSSEWAERGFCKNCGSSLFYHGMEDDSYYVPVDLLKDISGAKLTEEVMYDNKPNYYCFANDTEKQTEAQMFAQYVEAAEKNE